MVRKNIHINTHLCILFCSVQLLVGCAARVSFEVPNRYDVLVPEKKEYVYIDDFYRKDSNWNNDWIVYTKDKNVDYHVEFTGGNPTYGLALISANSWHIINGLLTGLTLGIIPYYNKAEMPLYIKIEDKKTNFIAEKQIGNASLTLWGGWVALFIPDLNAYEAMSDKQVELTSNIAKEIYDKDSELNQNRKKVQKRKEQIKKEKVQKELQEKQYLNDMANRFKNRIK